MINKKGQVLITFVLMIPIILLLISCLIEYGIMAYNKRKIYSLSKSIIASCIENPQKDDIINLYNKNGIDADIDITLEDGIKIYFNYEVNSFMGKLIGKDTYNILVDIKGKKEDNKIVYSKGTEND